MRPVLAALLALVLAAGAGCTAATNDAADLTDSEQKVADVVNKVETAARNDTPKKVCDDLLAAETARKLGDCPKAIQQAFDQADALQFSVDSVRITGDKARVRVVSGSDDDQTDLFELERSGDSWRITAISPVATKDAGDSGS